MLKRTITLALAITLSLAACSSDKSGGDDNTNNPAPTASEPAPSEPVSTEPNPAVESKPIPLLAWVDDLIDHHTSDQALPDTVDDKNIEANEDPAAFDKYLQ